MMKRKRKEEMEINFQDEIREILVCKYCTFETDNIDDLDNHILSHEEKCVDLEEECEDVIVLVDDLPNKKKMKQESLETHNCPYCKYTTKRKYDLPKHLLTHSTPETTTIYRCSQCPYETKRKNDMPKHMLAHCTDVQMYKCPDCPYQTKRKSDLPKHLLCHKPIAEVPLYKCDYCVYVTKRKGDLPKHVLSHKDQSILKLFDCSECDYKTKRKNDLHKHMLVHCDRHVEGVFKCLKCTYATDKVNKFSKHALSECTYCDDAITLEHLMLEDIIASVDDENIQFIGNVVEEVNYDEQNEYSEDYNEEEEETEDMQETYSKYGHYEEEEETENVQETYSEYANYRSDEEASKRNYRAEVKRRHGVFNINLGEFSMDDVEANSSQNTLPQESKEDGPFKAEINQGESEEES